jgi:hypothetical protein
MAMHPETLRASDPAQRYAITLSQGWLLRASNNLTLRDRDETPQTIDLEIHGWKGSATHGSEDAQLSQSITRHFNALAAERGTLLKQPSAVLAPLVGFALVSWMGITSVISWIVILFIAGFLYMQYRAVQQAKGGSPDA